jgi:hypothetical protein
MLILFKFIYIYFITAPTCGFFVVGGTAAAVALLLFSLLF